MNDRSVYILEQYDLEVLRTWKGRGAVLCDSSKGLVILKEYIGPQDKIVFQNQVCEAISENGFPYAERIIPNKEGNLLSKDFEEKSYVLKTYVEGRECDIKNRDDVFFVTQMLGELHSCMVLEKEKQNEVREFSLKQEVEKRNKELRKVRKFLKNKGQKTDFELFLSKNYELFFQQAVAIEKEIAEDTDSVEDNSKISVCHGDFQYHNIVIDEVNPFVMNFEKCVVGNQMRDLYRFLRKYYEKNGWSVPFAYQVMEHYQKKRVLTKEDYRQLYYRFAYPEKFWKIVNYYYNKGKSWVPGKNGEKLEILISQEKEKQEFLKEFRMLL